MVPPARRGRSCIALALAALLSAALPAASAAAPAASTAAAALAAARSSFQNGDPRAALETLRKLRANDPDSPLVIDSFGLSVACSLALGDDFRARYFLQRVREAAPRSAAAFTAGMLVAQRCYAAHAWLAALEYYRGAVESGSEGTMPARGEMDLALLRTAELSLYHGHDAPAARRCFSRISPENLPAAERILYRELRVRLLWRVIPPSELGLSDANVSSLRVDGDDLWVGTWNGGVARYSVSAMHSDPFPGTGVFEIDRGCRPPHLGRDLGRAHLVWQGIGPVGLRD